jgi:hypothetical protein
MFLPLHPQLREHSSAGSEHLPYKQRVTGSNPVAPTSKIKGFRISETFFLAICLQLRQKVKLKAPSGFIVLISHLLLLNK